MNPINQLEKEKEMLLLRLRSLEAKKLVLDQVSPLSDQASLLSLSQSGQWLETFLNR